MTYPALILDTSCLVHRAFHSSDLKLAPLSAKVGRLVSSIHSMRGQFRARMTVAALDLPGRTWRHERSSIYKANRRPKHPDLIELLNVVPSICAGLGIATVSHEGQEADDVIASLVEKTPGCALVTIDKDLYQLMGGADGPAVPGRVHIWHPTAGRRLSPRRIYIPGSASSLGRCPMCRHFGVMQATAYPGAREWARSAPSD